MKNNIKKKNHIILLCLGVIGLSFSVYHRIFADTATSVSSLSQTTIDEDTQKKLDELKRRADIYREIIDIKRKQGETLSNQLAVSDANINQTQLQIDENKQRIDDFNVQINRLDQQIKEKNDTIQAQQKLLANLVQAYYEISQANLATIYLTEGNLASFMVTKDRLSQTGDKIKELVDSILDIRKGLEAQSADLDAKKSEVVVAHENLTDKSSDLEAEKRQRELLIAQTKGEEARYTQLLAKVEQQKNELLNIDELYASSNISIGGLSALDYIKKNQPPANVLASTDWYYSQKDSRWGDLTIGNTKTLMKSYGCAVTAVAMVATAHKNSITPKDLARQPIFSSDLINWDLGAWSGARIKLASSYGHGNLNWPTVDTQLAKGNPVIVYISRTQGGGHYVVIHHKEASTGKYVVHDPYFGPNLYLDTSRALVGLLGGQSATAVTQMIIYN